MQYSKCISVWNMILTCTGLYVVCLQLRVVVLSDHELSKPRLQLWDILYMHSHDDVLLHLATGGTRSTARAFSSFSAQVFSISCQGMY
jgi:S-adenosylmethionine:diacylglycerol 3-amino-3-carboxypropyl transferase